jgi:hypothetical protein
MYNFLNSLFRRFFVILNQGPAEADPTSGKVLEVVTSQTPSL